MACFHILVGKNRALYVALLILQDCLVHGNKVTLASKVSLLVLEVRISDRRIASLLRARSQL